PRRPRRLVGVDDEVLVDDPDLVAVLAAELVERGARPLAVGTGELEGLDDRDRRRRGSLARRAVGRDRVDRARIGLGRRGRRVEVRAEEGLEAGEPRLEGGVLGGELLEAR